MVVQGFPCPCCGDAWWADVLSNYPPKGGGCMTVKVRCSKCAGVWLVDL